MELIENEEDGKRNLALFHELYLSAKTEAKKVLPEIENAINEKTKIHEKETDEIKHYYMLEDTIKELKSILNQIKRY